VSLTIPSQVRGSDYSLVDDYLEPRPSIWRFNGGYKLISENGSLTPIVIANFNPTSDTPPTEPSDVLSPSSPSDSEFKVVAK